LIGWSQDKSNMAHFKNDDGICCNKIWKTNKNINEKIKW
jgi:hypothetical protein